jgi:pimeloyl-ACP methyl ester carboxylesterase
MFSRLFPIVLLAVLAGCQTPDATRLDRSLAALKTHPSDARAQAEYRRAAARLLPDLLSTAPQGKPSRGWRSAQDFSDIDLIRRSRPTIASLHRSGVGLPVVGEISKAKSGDPNTPPAGHKVPLTALVLPAQSGGYEVRLADPTTLGQVTVDGVTLPLAMDLEAPIDSARSTAPRFRDGLRYLVRADRFRAPSQLVFLQPYDPNKIPVVFVHGLMSTPAMWVPVIKQLTAVKEIRDRYQFWFFFYPTGQPVPASALQLRLALDAAVKNHRTKKPIVLVGHSMGGILSRAQVSRITAEDALSVAPWLANLPPGHMARHALIFEPRSDIGRIVFLHTPHRGSRLALTGLAGLGMQIIRLPSNLMNELGEFAKYIVPGGRGRMPTSIQGLSPRSPFLALLDKHPPAVPHHTVLGDRGRKNSPRSSDGVVPYGSSHLDSAQTEVIVPGGHGSFTHPQAVQELERILLENR